MKTKLLVIDDDIFWCDVLKERLSEMDFQVEIAYDVGSGLKKAYALHPHTILLDLIMPGTDGRQACTRLREISNVPIIMLTAMSSSTHVTECLNLGADDYVVKTAEIDELAARIRAILRRTALPEPGDNKLGLERGIFIQDRLVVDLRKREITVDGKRVKLTSREFDLLSILVKYKGRVLPHEFLLTEAWGPEHRDDVASLRLYIGYLRRKLEKDPTHPHFIHSEWGVGYRFA